MRAMDMTLVSWEQFDNHAYEFQSWEQFENLRRLRRETELADKFHADEFQRMQQLERAMRAVRDAITSQSSLGGAAMPMGLSWFVQDVPLSQLTCIPYGHESPEA